MVKKIFHVEGNAVKAACELFVRSHFLQAYESNYENGFIRVYEDYSFSNGNDIMICIRVDASQAAAGKMIIEYIAGGANADVFRIKDGWNSENRRVKKFANDLQAFCNEKQLKLTE